MSRSPLTEDSFWQKLGDQQTTTTVGLGYVTTNPDDPSVSYWPGPGRSPGFTLGREWITHYVSAEFASTTDATTGTRQSIDRDTETPGLGLAVSHAGRAKDQDSFVSDLLITYKLKNPVQFLRDVFSPADLAEFASRFPASTSLFLVTGYKVSRNVSAAVDQQESHESGLRFALPAKLTVALPLPLPVPQLAKDVQRKVLSSVTFRAPGDSIFFVRYLRWVLGGLWRRERRTIVLPPDRAGTQRLLVTRDTVAVAVKKMHETKGLCATGQRTTSVSCDESEGPETTVAIAVAAATSD
ncbi:protein of unknown function [Taphrina deformans PYCC 5710]|uniref:Uncharacterized protein n=1 Tax=Taphrina deformans (strain PYCC 5710 / ATCC 11124 / CBS 356.35 / IMI 108563 / JCM 9778 / NBRC 8474) TaxID=1097556 RepID=R4XFK6_TAPDE|nr:protein of unknown function [Taphrina deformans PYCC 5710]|eukprot:CCG82122.1 protein of unknown function [Taphrina deformans PYCC 5710]